MTAKEYNYGIRAHLAVESMCCEQSAKNAPNRPLNAFCIRPQKTLDIRPPIAERIRPLLLHERDLILS